MPQVHENTMTSMQGFGRFVGYANDRGLVKVDALHELVYVDKNAVLDGVCLSRANLEQVLIELVDVAVQVTAIFRDGRWYCSRMVTLEVPRAGVTPSQMFGMGAGERKPLGHVNRGTELGLKSSIGRSVAPPPGFPAVPVDISQYPIERSTGVVVTSKATFGYIRSLKHGRVFFPACSLKGRLNRGQFFPNLRPGSLVAYEAAHVPRRSSQSVTGRGWVGQKVALVPPPPRERDGERNVIVGYGAISELQNFYGYIRTSETEHKIFFPRSNVQRRNGDHLPINVDVQCIFGEKVRFVAFFSGMNRMSDLRTPYVALFVQIERDVILRPIRRPGYQNRRRARHVSTSSGSSSSTSEMYHMENLQNMRRARSLGHLVSRPTQPGLRVTRYGPSGRFWASQRNIYPNPHQGIGFGNRLRSGYSSSLSDLASQYQRDPYSWSAPAQPDLFEQYVADLRRPSRMSAHGSIGNVFEDSRGRPLQRFDGPNLLRSRSQDRVVRFDTVDDIDRLYARERALQRARSAERCPQSGTLPSILKPMPPTPVMQKPDPILPPDDLDKMGDLEDFGFQQVNGRPAEANREPVVGNLIDF